MEEIEMFLQGPGGELRPVTTMEPELGKMIKETSQFSPPRKELRGIGRVIDSEGRVAVQADVEGFLYRYEERGPYWALVVR